MWYALWNALVESRGVVQSHFYRIRAYNISTFSVIISSPDTIKQSLVVPVENPSDV